jgi:hypothetical protein
LTPSVSIERLADDLERDLLLRHGGRSEQGDSCDQYGK